MKIMEPEINEIRKTESKNGKIYGAISMCRDLGLSENKILEKLPKNTYWLKLFKDYQ